MKHRFKILLLVIICSILLVQLAFSQPASPDILLKKFDSYRQKNLQEKIYVHLDQNFYLTGETLWFKIYNVDGSLHKPLDISKVAYIELLDKNNASILQSKVLLTEGNGAGSIFLPATIQSGNYIFRCYTNWMKNFSADFYFQKNITVVNPFVIPDKEKPKIETPIRVDFFPEGGYLVNGLRSKIAFKINSTADQDDYRGAVVDSNGDTLVTFIPAKFGIGNFILTPEQNQKYTAIFKDRNGHLSTHALPEAKENGYVMMLSRSDNKLMITVSSRFTEQPTGEFVYLFCHSRNTIFKAELKYLQSGKCEFAFDSDKLPPGISHFTILDHHQKPVCERLFFKPPQQQLNITANTDQAQYGKRRKVTLRLQTKIDPRNISSNLSVAVYKMDSLSKTETHNIYNYLWLSSDLKGFIQNAEYYFSTQDTSRAADNLMLTHGWRRFNWDNILTGNTTLAYVPEYRGHIVKGKVSQKNDSKAVGVLTYLSVPGKVVKFYSARSDNNGEVQFEVNQLQGQHKLILQAGPAESSSVNLSIESPFSKEYGVAPAKSFQLSPSTEKKFLERSVAMQVQDIYYEDQTITQQQTSQIDTLAFFGVADETYYLDRYTRFPVMEEVMREYVPGVFVRKRKDGFNFIVVDMVNQGVIEGDPMILLDGVPLFDADKIMAVDPHKVKKLEVVKRKYYLGPLYMPGIVSFTSYQGDIAGLEMDPSAVSLNYEGLQLYREFFSTRYETQKQLNSRMPDRRFLLYWNPLVITNKEGVCELEFYTSDVTGQFQVVVEGITSEGHAGSESIFFTVK